MRKYLDLIFRTLVRTKGKLKGTCKCSKTKSPPEVKTNNRYSIFVKFYVADIEILKYCQECLASAPEIVSGPLSFEFNSFFVSKKLSSC